jgi:hypothetical protein
MILGKLYRNFRTSVKHPVACIIEVTINTVYAILLIYYCLVKDVLPIAIAIRVTSVQQLTEKQKIYFIVI